MKQPQILNNKTIKLKLVTLCLILRLSNIKGFPNPILICSHSRSNKNNSMAFLWLLFYNIHTPHLMIENFLRFQFLMNLLFYELKPSPYTLEKYTIDFNQMKKLFFVLINFQLYLLQFGYISYPFYGIVFLLKIFISCF